MATVLKLSRRTIPVGLVVVIMLLVSLLRVPIGGWYFAKSLEAPQTFSPIGSTFHKGFGVFDIRINNTPDGPNRCRVDGVFKFATYTFSSDLPVFDEPCKEDHIRRVFERVKEKILEVYPEDGLIYPNGIGPFLEGFDAILLAAGI